MSSSEAERQARDVTQFAATSLGELYGANWGDPWTDPRLRLVLDQFVLPKLSGMTRLCEIGSGGGRWSRYLIRTGKPVLMIDGSPESETLIRALQWTDSEAESMRTQAEFLVSRDGRVPHRYSRQFDYVFTFDTFVHFDLALVLEYLRSISRMLRPGGVFHLHYADLLSSHWFANLDEWESACQSFRYIGRQEITALLHKFGLRETGLSMEFSANGSRLIECRLMP